MKLSEICADPKRFGCVFIVPEPQLTAPWGPVKVVKARLDPNTRFGTLTYSKDKKDGWDYPGATLARGDCLIHVPSGATAAIVSRESSTRVLVEGWSEPPTDEAKAKWVVAPGLGRWVVWGTAFRTVEEVPPHARPGEVIGPADMAEARKDLLRHPERLPWQQLGYKLSVDPNKLSRGKRKKLRGQLRKLLGAVLDAQSAEDIDALIEKYAIKRVKSKEGGEWIRWRINPRHLREK